MSGHRLKSLAWGNRVWICTRSIQIPLHKHYKPWIPIEDIAFVANYNDAFTKMNRYNQIAKPSCKFIWFSFAQRKDGYYSLEKPIDHIAKLQLKFHQIQENKLEGIEKRKYTNDIKKQNKIEHLKYLCRWLKRNSRKLETGEILEVSENQRGELTWVERVK